MKSSSRLRLTGVAIAALFAAGVGGSGAALRWLAPAAPTPEPVRHTLARFAARPAPATVSGPAPVFVPASAPVSPAAAPAAPAPAPNPLLHLVARTRARFRDGSFTGPAFNAYYGWVQVQAIVRHGSLVSVRVLRYPSDRYTSRRIAQVALPMLEREVIRAQSARVHAVSGATLDSRAFMRSMDAALRRAAG